MEEKIIEIKTKATQEISKAKSKEELFDIEKKYLGRKSEFNEILKGIKDLSEEEKKQIGSLANTSKIEIQNYINETQKTLEKDSFNFDEEKIDITIPGNKKRLGHLNILSQVKNEIEDIFAGMGFEITDGPEIETEWYDFDALNIPKDHPARDMQDSFWLKNEGKKERILLRTQTSPVQVRYMQKNKPPFKIISPGKCFRREATDSTHDHTFYQFEALVVNEDINIGNMKYIAEKFFSQFFKKDIKLRLRPSYFPFVEPGFEFDISCTMCDGKGCRACKGNGWLELGGCGMVNQAVFVASGYPRNKPTRNASHSDAGGYQGFAWGFGLERLAMMKYKINDIRLFNSGDLRFINQF